MTSTQPKPADKQEYLARLDALSTDKTRKIAARYYQKLTGTSGNGLLEVQAEIIAPLIVAVEIHNDQARLYEQEGNYPAAGAWAADAAQLATLVRTLRDTVMPV